VNEILIILLIPCWNHGSLSKNQRKWQKLLCELWSWLTREASSIKDGVVLAIVRYFRSLSSSLLDDWNILPCSSHEPTELRRWRPLCHSCNVSLEWSKSILWTMLLYREHWLHLQLVESCEEGFSILINYCMTGIAWDNAPFQAWIGNTCEYSFLFSKFGAVPFFPHLFVKGSYCLCIIRQFALNLCILLSFDLLIY